MNDTLYILLFLFSVLVSSFSQVLLKKSANKKHESKIKEYKNKEVIIAYILFLGSTFMTMMAYRGVDISLGPILESIGFVYVAVMSRLILKERITKRQVFAICLIMIGISISVIF